MKNTKRFLYIVLTVFVLVLLLFVVYVTASSGNTNTEGMLVPYDAHEHSFGENLIFGLETAGVGMGIVFAVLIILWGIIAFIPKLIGGTEKDKAVAAKPVETATAEEPGSDEAKLVAICTAAIAAERGKSDCAFKVISITEIN